MAGAARSPSLQSLSVAEFLDALASGEPTPGGGGAGALATALGAALIAMTGRLTIGRRRYADVDAQMRQTIARADEIRAEAFDLISEDAHAYQGVMDALALPRSADAEKATRATAVARAALAATRVPARVGALAVEVMGMAAFATEHGNRHVTGDAGGAAALARASIRISEMNIVANLALAGPGNATDYLDVLARLRAARDRSDALVDRVLDQSHT